MHIQPGSRITQNVALHTATGCIKTAPTDHVHHETKVLKLQDHMAHTPTPPTQNDSTHYITYPKTARSTETNGKHQSTTTPTSTTSSRTPRNTSMRTHIHTHFSNRGIHAMKLNTKLDRYLSSNQREGKKIISCEERVYLSRLRCRHRPVLPSYTQRINLTDSDTCTLCKNAEGSLEHIILEIQHTLTRTLLDTLYESLQLPARFRGDPEHTHLIPTLTITQPWWVGRGRFILRIEGHSPCNRWSSL